MGSEMCIRDSRSGVEPPHIGRLPRALLPVRVEAAAPKPSAIVPARPTGGAADEALALGADASAGAGRGKRHALPPSPTRIAAAKSSSRGLDAHAHARPPALAWFARSVCAGRSGVTDSGCYFDTKAACDRAVRLDWARACQPWLMRALLAAERAGSGGGGLDGDAAKATAAGAHAAHAPSKEEEDLAALALCGAIEAEFLVSSPALQTPPRGRGGV